MIRFLLFVLLLLVSLLVEGQVCNVSGTTLSSQAQINNFGNRPTCGTIIVTGDLRIQNGSDIVSLAALDKVTEISGRLILFELPNLSSLNGLHNLQTISGGGSITMYRCNALNDCSGLSSLTNIGVPPYQPASGISVNDCANFSSFNGLAPISRINGINVSDCPQFSSFQGFESLNEIEGTLFISNISAGTDFSGLENLTTVNVMDLRANGISSFQGVTSLDSVASISLSGNGPIRNLKGLESLARMGQFSIVDTQLDSISDISTLTKVGRFNIQSNNVLTKITLPDYLEFGSVYIGNNDGLETIQANGNYFGRSELAPGNFSEFTIAGNSNLTSLSGLIGQMEVPRLAIFTNTQLSDCAAQMICDLFSTGTSAIINRNAPNCNSVSEVEAACVALPITWQRFTAVPAEKGTELSWSTVQEENNAGFIVEHSRDGLAFQPIMHLRPRPQEPDGNHSYDWFHETTLGGAHYYRIRQEDIDGSTHYSEVRLVTLKGEDDLVVYPTVVRNELTVEVQVLGQLRIVSAAGRLMARELLHPGKSILDVSGWPSGVYLVQSNSGTVKRVIR